MQLQNNYQEPVYKSQSNVGLPRYTSILYEEGIRQNITIGQTFLVLSLEPLQIKATISFGALEVTNISQTKKIASHMAAKEICSKLNFTVQLS
jgi:hypothetical protein